jgi:aminoglycoside phosphotransferase family enzyme/predicted kinase
LDAQAEVLAFLEGGGLGGRPERIDTHAAVVLLEGDRAFKLKRAVRFSFLDFGTLARRRAALEEELRLNRRTAPGLYRRLVPVTREAGGGLALAGPGEPVEWLLEMARFPSPAQLDRVAARGALDAELAERLGLVLARFHGRLAAATAGGGAGALEAVVRGNAADLRELVPSVLEGDRVEAVVAAIDRALEPAREPLERRAAAGQVRRGHGDLHLANIVLLDGEPVPFDCLEFDAELATTDLLYDAAFPVMDLLAHGLPGPARACLQAWLDARLDEDGLVLLPLLLAVRATVRAKVEGFTARASGGPAEAARHRAAAARYLELALATLEPRPARLIAVGGRSGTGKSSLALALAPGLGRPPGALVLRSDVVRKRLLGRQPTERLPDEAYGPALTERVFGALAARAERALRAGWSVIADAVWGEPGQRARIGAAAAAAGVPFAGLWLEAPEPVLEARVAARTGDASDADPAVVRRQAGRVRAPAAAEGWSPIEAAGSLAATLAAARSALAETV